MDYKNTNSLALQRFIRMLQPMTQKRNKKGRFLPKIQTKPNVKRLSNGEVQLFNELRMNNSNFVIGYTLARILSNRTKTFKILGLDIPQYMLLFASLFIDNEFLRGMFLGAGTEDLPSLLDDLSPQLHELSDNIREFQNMETRWESGF